MLAWCQTHQFNINHFFFTDSVLLYSFFWMSYLGYTKYFLTEAFFGNFFCFYCIFFAIILVFNICFMQHFNLRSKIKMIIWQQTLLEFGENLIFMFFFSLSAAELISFHSNLIILIISNYVLLPKKMETSKCPISI